MRTVAVTRNYRYGLASKVTTGGKTEYKEKNLFKKNPCPAYFKLLEAQWNDSANHAIEVRDLYFMFN
jgi:hypothetical protein